MKTASTKKRSFHKKASALAAAISIFALMITGTYAWFSGAINAENIFTGQKLTPEDPPVVLHDDFENPLKDVYVENTGEKTVFVRVRFNEIWDLTTDKKPASIPKEEWYTHIPGTVDSHLEHTAIAPDDIYHDHFVWTWGDGLSKDYIKGDGSQTDGVYQSTKAEIDAMNQSDPSQVGTTPIGDIVCADWYVSANFIDEYNEYADRNLTDRSEYIGWIYDADGWAYWSQPLKGGEVTGLLLHEVTTVDMDDYDYYYIIDVNLESVDLADLNAMWIGGGPSVDPDKYAQSTRADKLGRQALEFIRAF